MLEKIKSVGNAIINSRRLKVVALTTAFIGISAVIGFGATLIMGLL